MRLILRFVLCLLFTVTAAIISWGQGIIHTIAGNGITQYIGDGYPATNYSLGGPKSIFVDKNGAVYVANYYTTRISKIFHDTLSTIMGNGTASYTGDGGPATAATFTNPDGVFLDTAGNIFVTDWYNDVVRKTNIATGIITTVCGDGGGSFAGDGGPATLANMENPSAVCVDAAGNIYVPDYGNHRIRKVTASTGIIRTIAGTGVNGYSGDGGQATAAQLSYPNSVATDLAGNVYFTERGNNVVRKISVATGIITTVAGKGTPGYTGDGVMATDAELFSPNCVFVDKHGYLYISDYGNNVIRAVTAAGFISTIAGTGGYGYSGDGGPATAATFLRPTAVFVDDSGYIYIADGDNSAIRKMTPIVFSGAGIRNVSIAGFNVYPNPSTGRFSVYTSVPDPEAVVVVFNTLGQSIYRVSAGSIQTDIDISGYPPGMYYVHYASPEGNVVRKVIITH